MASNFIPHSPRFTADTANKKIVSSTYEAIMHNVTKPDNKVLIHADATRRDNSTNNITRYMENHAIPLGENYRILPNRCYAFTVKDKYMDKTFFSKTPEQYEEDLIAYLRTITPSQVGKDDNQMKIERTETNYCPSADLELNGYRINRFLCNSDHGGCSWYLAEHMDNWYQDGTLIVIVKKFNSKSWPDRREPPYFMYPETPLLFGLNFLNSGPRAAYKNEICTDSKYILDRDTVEKNIENAEQQFEKKQFVTITRTLLTAMNSIHKYLYNNEDMHEYENFEKEFRQFVYYFCAEKAEELRHFQNKQQKKVFEEFWGNITLDYNLPKDISAAEDYDVRKDIYWPTSERRQRVTLPVSRRVQTYVLVTDIQKDQEAIKKELPSNEGILIKFEYVSPQAEIVRDNVKHYVYTQGDKAKIGNVEKGETIYVWNGRIFDLQQPTSWVRKGMRYFFSRK